MLAAALLEDAATGTRWVLVAVTGALTAGGIVLFRRLGDEIRAHGGPGYDEFQRAGSAAAVREALEGWGPDGLAAARRAWMLDLLFPVCYAVFFALLASLAATHAASLGWDGFSTAMAVVSSLALTAGGVDLLVENPAVAAGLWRTPRDGAARLARAAGAVKLLLLGVVLVALLGAGAAFLLEKL